MGENQNKQGLELTKYFMDNAAIGIFLFTLEGKIEYVNKRAEEMLNYEAEELAGKTISDIDPTYTGEDRQERWEDLKKNRTQQIITIHETKEGGTFPVEVISRYLEFEGLAYELAFVQDISARKEKEEKLKKQNYRMKKMHELAHEFEEINSAEQICEKTLNYADDFLNLKFCNITLVETEMLIPRKVTSGARMDLKTDSMILDSLASKTYKKGESIIIEGEKNSSDSLFFADFHNIAISIPVGEYGVFQAVADREENLTKENLELAELLISHTTTALKRINYQKKLKNSERRYRTIFDLAPMGVMLEDEKRGILEVNKAMTEITGYSKKELENSNIFDTLVLTENADRLKNNIEKLKKGNKLKFNIKSRTRDGREIYKQVTETSIRLPDGDEGILSLHLDVTERWEKEQTIKELHGVAVDFKKLEDKKEICEKTVEVAKELFDFEFCNIRMVKNDQLIPIASTREVVEKQKPLAEEGIACKTYRENESFIVDDAQNNSEANPLKKSYLSGLSIPIGDYGVFQAVTKETKAFTEEDLELGELLISHTVAALDRIYSQKEIRYKTYHDSLTELYNRRFFEEELERLDTERQLPLSIIMGDINGLKSINDSFGHKIGDKLLIKTARLLENTVRKEDILARWGGDEFTVLLPNTNKKEAQKVVKRIKEKCQFTENDWLSVSIGLGTATKIKADEQIEKVLKQADKAMYRDKKSNS